jgi:hypothetical protein
LDLVSGTLVLEPARQPQVTLARVSGLEEFARLVAGDHGLVVVSTLRPDSTIQSSVVNAGVLPHPVTGAPGRHPGDPEPRLRPPAQLTSETRQARAADPRSGT